MTRNDHYPQGPRARAGDIRVGHGYDLHRLERQSENPDNRGGRKLIVGGVVLDATVGPVGHSDGDVLFHATTDALLGALALPDIGQLFPDSDPANEGRDSADFVIEAMKRVEQLGWVVGNLDTTVILEQPHLGPHKIRMRENLARLLEVRIQDVNLKGKSHEKVDAIGEGRAIEAHAVVVLVGRG